MLNREDMWSLTKKKEQEQPTDIENVEGIVINSIGRVVCAFGMFGKKENESYNLEINEDGFLGKIYKSTTPFILGYGQPNNIPGLLDIKFSNLLILGPEHANNDKFVINVPNDEKFIKQGLRIIIREDDVDFNLLNPEIQNQFKQDIFEAQKPIEDLSEIEASHIEYVKKIYTMITDGLEGA